MAQESCNLDKDEPEILKPSPSPSPAPPSPTPAPTPLFLKPPLVQRSEPSIAFSAAAEDESQPPVRFGNRCSSCRKRVGLTGFRCRCGDLFCPRHRYSDTHDCSFDYKAAGREEISKANPVIRAAKIIKI